MPTLVSSLCVILAAVMGMAGAQTPEIRPSWKDLETWARYDATTNETEIGIGLQPAGATGAVALAFTARVPGKTVRPVATEITAVVAMGPLFNSTVIRNPALTFLYDVGKRPWLLLDLSPRFIGNELPPTTRLTSGIARMTPEEFRTIAGARGVRANLLGAEVALTRPQLDALRAFAQKTTTTTSGVISRNNARRYFGK